ncbi:hypothetical protein D9M68_602390 [compost metagenome]
MQGQTLPYAQYVTQVVAAFLESGHANVGTVQAATERGLAGLAGQEFSGFGCHGSQRVINREAFGDRLKPRRGIEAARARGPHQITGLRQRVQKVQATAFRQVQQARQF